MTDLGESQLIGGRFRIRALLGSGGTASVYEALDVDAGGLVAVKVLHPHLDDTPGLRAAFLREAAVAETMLHPAVVRLVAACDAGSRETWTAWAFAPGVTLSELVRTRGPLDPRRALLVADRVLGALGAVHAAGYVHRDVSASNVLVQIGPDGEIAAVTLIDFGLADRPGRSARSADVLVSDAPLEAPAGVVGNPSYASPEQLRGEAVGVAGDLYQVGGLLHFALVGEPPFVRGSTDETIRAHLSALPPTVSVRVRGVAVEIDRVVVRALLKEPDDRFPSADAMREALASAASAPPRRSVEPHPPLAEPSDAPRSATRVLPAPVVSPAPVTADARSRTSPMTWVLLSAAAILVGALVFALVPRGAPVEARDSVPMPSATVPVEVAPSISPTASAPSPSQPTADPRVPVPSIVGRSESEARDILAAAGLRVATPTASSDGPDAVGTVVATTPAPGEVTPPGSAVSLTVASGFAAIPDVRGTGVDAAQYDVASAGFAIVLQRASSTTVPAGTVIAVDPAVGARLAHGTRVTLVVSTGAPTATPVPVPPTPTPTPTPEPTR